MSPITLPARARTSVSEFPTLGPMVSDVILASRRFDLVRSLRRGAIVFGLAIPLAVLPLAPLYPQAPPPSVSDPVVGPTRGSLVVAGGGDLGPEIWDRFVSLAGGEQARIVVIPTAAPDEDLPDDWKGRDGLQATGARGLVILHTRDPSEADIESFVLPLQEATGVWLPGGRPWRLVDAYLHTRVHEELYGLLNRGGVIGGTSAGASIQASFLIRGDPETNQVVYSPDYTEGFGFLERVAVDQHLLARGREADLWQVLDIHPELLGIGLDEGTALVIQGNRAEVIGKSQVLLYDASAASMRPSRLGAGTVFDLGSRELIGQAGPGFPTRGTVHGDDF